MLTNLTIKEYFEKLKSASPTPGGGSALALTGLTAASLGIMAANVTVAKFDKLGRNTENLTELLKALKPVEIRFSEIIDDDPKAFDAILAAMRMPKNTAEEAEMRREKLQKAYFESALLCLSLAEYSVKTYELCVEVAFHADTFVASDAEIGAELAKQTALSAKEVVHANTVYIDNAVKREALEKRLHEILKGLI